MELISMGANLLRGLAGSSMAKVDEAQARLTGIATLVLAIILVFLGVGWGVTLDINKDQLSEHDDTKLKVSQGFLGTLFTAFAIVFCFAFFSFAIEPRIDSIRHLFGIKH